MQIQNSSSPSFLSISTFIVFIFTFPTSFCQENELFRNCSSVFSCGKNFPNITYPFWGGNKSQDCGLEGFHLTCQKDDHLTISIADQSFRVLGINRTSYALRIARNDLWDDVCPDNYQNTPFDVSLFRPETEVQNLTLYYACPYPDYENSRNRFSCTNISDHNATIDFFTNDIGGCDSNISVLALEREAGRNASVTLQQLLYEGFNVEYNLNSTACFPCELSGGLCWSATNLTGSSCLCSDGPRELFCVSAGQGGRSNIAVKIGIALGAFALSAVVMWLAYFLYRNQSFAFMILRRKTKEDRNLEAFIKKYGSLAPKRYSYSDIKTITKSFKDELGRGGYGSVYKGKLLDGRPVAVKILNIEKDYGEEFINEVLSISRTSHVNVVMLLGFCLEGKRRALVYEYMPNGSLEKYIHGGKNCIIMSCNQILGMDKLYLISLGVARGLEYLHLGCNIRILHFDIKPHNILLDKDFSPKISDLGMAKQCNKQESIVSILGGRGTTGYIAPEIVSRSFGGVSYKYDVYS